MNEPKIVKLCEVTSRFEAQLIAGILKESGIPHLLKDSGASSWGLWQGPDWWSFPDQRVSILVPESALERAGEIVERAKASGRSAR